MALVPCKVCRRVFISGDGEESVCPNCTSQLGEIYFTVRNFLRDNDKKHYTALEVSEILGIDLHYIEGLVALGWVETTHGAIQKTKSPIKIRPPDPDGTQPSKRRDSRSSMHKYSKKKGDQ